MNGVIGNIVFDAPRAGSPERYRRAAGAIASLYADLLGKQRASRADMHRRHGWPADEGDELDPMVLDVDGDDGIRFAFEGQSVGYEPPRWPDPMYPQQVHLDLFVPSPEESERIVLQQGGQKLADGVYADPVGHPLCIEGYGESARIGRIVFDCSDPHALADFYSAFLDMPVRVEEAAERVVIAREVESIPMLAFEKSPADPPNWPDPLHPEQVHLDFKFEDPQMARAEAERLGATCLRSGEHHSVLADPFGHPFCL